MTESQMQTFFRDYIAKNPPQESEAYELKIEKGNRLSFEAVRPHQVEGLLQTEEGHFFHKMTDPPMFAGSRTRFNKPRPFDCFCLVKVKSFVVVWFYKPREKKVFIKIPIKRFLTLKNMSTMKSFTEQEAKEIGEQLFI